MCIMMVFLYVYNMLWFQIMCSNPTRLMYLSIFLESNITAVNRTANVAKVSNVLPFKNNSAITIIPKNPQPQQRGTGKPMGRIGGNSSGTGIIKQDVTVKPWSPRTGTSVGDVSIPMGGNRNIGSQQPMAQARPYFHRTNTGSSAGKRNIHDCVLPGYDAIAFHRSIKPHVC